MVKTDVIQKLKRRASFTRKKNKEKSTISRGVKVSREKVQKYLILLY